MKSPRIKKGNVIYLKKPKKVRVSKVGSRYYYYILACTITLLAIGLIMILSSSSIWAYNQYNDMFYYLKRQIVYALFGLFFMFILSRVNYHKLKDTALLWLGGSIFLLAIVLLPGIGRLAGGATRWIELGPITIQPSEVVKLAVIIYLATALSRKKFNINDLNHIGVHILLLLVIIGLVFIQPDLGTAFVITIIVFIIFFLAGMDLKILGTSFMLGSISLLIAIMSEDYRRERLLSFLNPWKDPQDSGFHIIQSWLALGTGGITGVGLGYSRQKFLYLPAAHTDFIFSIIGEETGLIGTLLITALFLLLIYFGLMVTFRSNDLFGQLLAGGITSLIALQTFINIGGVVGILPITGIPLPLISFGGTSLLLTLCEIGILLNISLNLREERRIRVVHKVNNQRRGNSRPRTSRNISSRRTSFKR